MDMATAHVLVRKTPSDADIPLTVDPSRHRVLGIEGKRLYTDKRLLVACGDSAQSVSERLGPPRARLKLYPPTKPPVSNYRVWVYPVGDNSVEILVDEADRVRTVALRNYVEGAR